MSEMITEVSPYPLWTILGIFFVVAFVVGVLLHIFLSEPERRKK